MRIAKSYGGVSNDLSVDADAKVGRFFERRMLRSDGHGEALPCRLFFHQISLKVMDDLSLF